MNQLLGLSFTPYIKITTTLIAALTLENQKGLISFVSFQQCYAPTIILPSVSSVLPQSPTVHNVIIITQINVFLISFYDPILFFLLLLAPNDGL